MVTYILTCTRNQVITNKIPFRKNKSLNAAREFLVLLVRSVALFRVFHILFYRKFSLSRNPPIAIDLQEQVKKTSMASFLFQLILCYPQEVEAWTCSLIQSFVNQERVWGRKQISYTFIVSAHVSAHNFSNWVCEATWKNTAVQFTVILKTSRIHGLHEFSVKLYFFFFSFQHKDRGRHISQIIFLCIL